jgi:hypothetical protein
MPTTSEVRERHTPFLVPREGIDGVDVADGLACGTRQRQVLDEHVALADLVLLDIEVLVHASLVQGVRVEQARLRTERGVLPVLGAARRRPVLGGLGCPYALRDLGFDGPAVFGSTWLAQFTFPYAFGGSAPLLRSRNIEKTVAVELHRDLALCRRR